jgi:predicted acylesterase/phospholipase RssA
LVFVIPGTGARYSQRIELHPLDPSRRSHAHDFVDGGVLNNSPVNVAVDAGATHIISLELDPLRQVAPLDSAAVGGEPLVPENLARTFSTLLNLATTEDVYRTVAINRMLRETPLPKRRIVELFRFAPVSRDLGTLEFDGHYPDAFSPPNPSLVAWLDRGSADARTGRPFWLATYQTWP